VIGGGGGGAFKLGVGVLADQSRAKRVKESCQKTKGEKKKGWGQMDGGVKRALGGSRG